MNSPQSKPCSGSCAAASACDTPVSRSPDTVAQVSTFSIPKMDCPSEENLIRMALSNVEGLGRLEFDLKGRRLELTHSGGARVITEKLESLDLGAVLLETKELEGGPQVTRTRVSISKMDCASEENLVRMALADMEGIDNLSFDLRARELTVLHSGNASEILQKLMPLQLGAEVLTSSTEPRSATQPKDSKADEAEAKTLKLLLAINGSMFIFEMVVGLLAQSTGLIADSLDMFADAAVYGLALYAVGRAAALKLKAAHLAGWLQVVLALGALVEVARRAILGSEPQSSLMMGIGLIALAANIICLVLISKKRDRGAHMTASYIFSANDVIANLGVVAAGALVAWTGSALPDLVIGAIIGVVVLSGAQRILKLR